MADTNVITTSPNLSGDITSCEIKTKSKEVKVDSEWSLRQETTYITYNVCTKEILSEYKIPEFTPIASFGCIGMIALLFLFACAALGGF